MRERIIELLALPRQIARSNVELHGCRHAGHFAAHDTRCVQCEFNIECEWLHGADEFSALSEKPIDDVLDALEFATSYVDAHITRGGHSRLHCECDACRWLRDANAVLDGLERSDRA